MEHVENKKIEGDVETHRKQDDFISLLRRIMGS
jgi:hypothetical protein